MTRLRHVVRSWNQAQDTYSRFARTPQRGGDKRVNLGYATWLHQREESGGPAYAVRFHATDVVTFHPNGSITIATDGWLTKTTRERIEDFTPAEVWLRTRGIPARRGSTVEPMMHVMVGRGERVMEFDISDGSSLLLHRDDISLSS